MVTAVLGCPGGRLGEVLSSTLRTGQNTEAGDRRKRYLPAPAQQERAYLRMRPEFLSAREGMEVYGLR